MFADHVPAADAEALRRARARRRDPGRQDADPRVRVGDLLGQRADGHEPQPVGARPHLGRLERRLGRGARLAPGDARPRQRHRRLDPRALGVLRHRRLQADLRTRQPRRDLAARPHARPSGPDGAHACRRSAAARGRSPATTRPIRRPPTCRSATSTPRSRAGSRAASSGICPDLHLVPLAPAVAGAFDAAVAAATACGARIEEVRIPEASDVYDDVRRHAARRGPAHARRGRPLPGAGRRVRGRRARPARAGRDARAFATTCAPPRSAARMRAAFARAVRGGRPAPDAGLRRARRCRSAARSRRASRSERSPFRELVMSYTTPQDLARPAGLRRSGRASTSSGSPIGVQFTGAPWEDATVLGAAHAVFEATPAVQDALAGDLDDARRSPTRGGHDALEGALPLRRDDLGRLRRRDALERHVQAAHAEPAVARRLRHPRGHPAHPRAARRARDPGHLHGARARSSTSIPAPAATSRSAAARSATTATTTRACSSSRSTRSAS